MTSNPTGVHKSGYRTGTTTGTMTETFYSVQAPNLPRGYTGHVSVLFWGFARISHMGWGPGDSGAPVFVRSTVCGVYCAIGLQSGGQGSQSLISRYMQCGNGMLRCHLSVECNRARTPHGPSRSAHNSLTGGATTRLRIP